MKQQSPDSRILTSVEKAWEELYIAEGSDWFWWYGDDHTSAQDALFDYLFRKHLQNVYLLLGDLPPPELSRPISRKSQRPAYTFPRAFLDVKIDGKRTFFEWLAAGKYTCQGERGTMAQAAKGPLRELYFGFDARTLFVRIDCDRPAHDALADFDALRLYFVEPAGWEVLVQHPGRLDQQVRVTHEGLPAPPVLAAVAQIAEVAVPFELLAVKPDQAFQFFVELVEAGQSRDRAPREGTIQLVCPTPEFEQIMWDV